MTTFFRKLRQNLSSNEKVSGFFKYAIGEIILVMIGILLALQVSNWNDERQVKKLEIKFLEQIKSNLQSDLTDIDFNIDFNKVRQKSGREVLKFLNGETQYHDLLNYYFANLMYTTRTLVNSSAYENLKSRGLEIISNDSLRQTITTLYSFHVHNVVDFETQDDHPFQYQSFIPEVLKVINIKEAWKDAEPIDQQQLLRNYTFRSALTENLHLREYMLENYERLKRKVKECIAQIEAELERLK